MTIIVFHVGNQEYVNLQIKQAEYYNNKVILIGDDSNKDFCKHHYYHNTLQNAYNESFEKHYKHISPNNQVFEKVCIERWISIYNLMKQENIEKAFICDSDVLIYTNIRDIANKYYKNDLYISTTSTKYKVTAGQSIWTQGKLKEFIDFIINFYQNSDWDYIINYWNTYLDKISGGISDMYLLYCFLTKTNFSDNHFVLTPDKLDIEYDLSQVINGGFFDNSIDLDSDAFGVNKWGQEYYNFNCINIENKIKNIIMDKDKLTCYNHALLKNCNVNSIHFHGCKNLMTKYTTFKSKISAIFFSLNDNYTTDNKERLIICLNMMDEAVDEIIYIDWGSPNGISLLDLDFVKSNIVNKNKNKIKHIKFTREQINELVPEGCHFIQQSIIRNIGIRFSTGDYIISTNMDIIFPKREGLMDIINNDDKKTFYSLNRKNVDICIATAIYNNSKDKLRDILSEYITFRNTEHDINPIEAFKKECLNQLDINSDAYKAYIQYAKIWNTGDFQMAHRDIWYKVKGFEESMVKGSMGTDTNLQKKICNYGYKLEILNKPDIFHLSHTKRSSSTQKKLDLNRFIINFTKSENDDNWGARTNISY